MKSKPAGICWSVKLRGFFSSQENFCRDLGRSTKKHCGRTGRSMVGVLSGAIKPARILAQPSCQFGCTLYQTGRQTECFCCCCCCCCRCFCRKSHRGNSNCSSVTVVIAPAPPAAAAAFALWDIHNTFAPFLPLGLQDHDSTNEASAATQDNKKFSFRTIIGVAVVVFVAVAFLALAESQWRQQKPFPFSPFRVCHKLSYWLYIFTLSLTDLIFESGASKIDLS